MPADTPLTQPEREAIIDLLLFAMYEDRHIALQEDEFIDSHVMQLGWQSGMAVETYVKTATARVRSTRDTAEGKERWLQHIAARLQSRSSRDTAQSLCRSLLNSDARETAEESAFEAQLRALLA